MIYDPVENKEHARRVAYQIVGLAQDFQRLSYPVNADQALRLAAFAWAGAELQNLRVSLENESALLRARSVLNGEAPT